MLDNLLRRSDLVLSIGVVGILGVMIIPIPPIFLDLALSFSITLAIIVLLVSTSISRPLDFSVFPSVLLVSTLLRLSLNIASTRLILMRGDEGIEAAGKVIKSFGEFVVGGNFVVGFVIFFILVIINFVVITKGAGRIAEVSARFTLDAMPGKQMSIDADLNAGLIDDAEARRRRQDISREADFYGSMDGASKFVRGDAIAGIIIMVINIIGGFLIGVLQKGMPMAEAAKTYTILTVGDGLVAQIPALVTSTAAGMIVTRAASEANLGAEVIKQLFTNSKALGATAGILAFFGLIPGLPHIPFLMLSAVTGTGAYFLGKAVKREEEAALPAAEAIKPVETLESLLPIDALSLEIGYGLIPLVEEGGPLLARIKAVRKQTATDMGFIVPPIHIKDNLSLKPMEYSILIKGVEVASAEVMVNKYLAISPGTEKIKIEGIPAVDPTFGLPAVWIDEIGMERAQLAGYTVVDVPSVIITHITEVIKSYAHELLGKQDVQKLLDNTAKTQPKVVEDLIPGLLNLSAVQRVLHNLLKERVSIRDLQTILETLSDYASATKDPDFLTEYVRQALARSITKQIQNADGSVSVIVIDPKVERTIIEAVQTTPQGAYLALDPAANDKIVNSIKKSFEGGVLKGYQPVILCSQAIRRFVKKLSIGVSSSIMVVSHSEIAPNTKVFSIGTIKME
ncbi:MAG TPA: flagellar biosynthesis protein FlhA [Nitrospiraceae bacterium]|nr:MAG: flagellar biosynthesis protein FlhA [Nitrospirae bacterium GWA2_46_11]OGW23148.1 MAG: flagellar biosynthesis protein FlhA [Nitrospirae bacterium GWB2_47_37]HAK87697.1 flagellar biosynthesis protein FlhA [Nitrospiraceae bacterium]HCZ12332.1 flagellar biosynthesis protein FlhA [Nitrospiraceae bacterium]